MCSSDLALSRAVHPVPILHIAEATADALDGKQRVALLGSDATTGDGSFFVERLRKRGFEVTLEIVGGGAHRDALLSQIADLGLQCHVELLGRLPEEGVRDALARADVFCLGSYDEAIGVATMEAMAMELPVVVTRVGGVPELVREGVDGWLVDPSSPEQMVDALLELIENRERGREMGRAGRARVVASFGAKRSAEALQRRVSASRSLG